MPKKEDCKYWDKCYQKNEPHLQKYNHPKPPKPEISDTEKKDQQQTTPTTTTTSKANDMEVEAAATSTSTRVAPKRKSSDEEEVTTNPKQKPESTIVSSSSNVNGAEATAATTTTNELETSELRKEALSNIAGKNYMEILQKRIKLSVQAEYDELLRTNEFIRYKFLVEMPPDFYAFWKWISTLKENVTGVPLLEYFDSQFQLQLVGPFEFLAGRFHNATIREPGDYLRHWRFFYDPPEFQTIFVRRGTGVHYGYWRDTPQDKEDLLIARNDAQKGCEFEFVAGNVFDAFLYYLEHDFKASPFATATVANTKKSMQKFIETNEVCVKKLEELRKKRNAKVVTKTFHRAGIVVPFDTKTQLGYRPLIVSDAELKKILQMFEKNEKGEKEQQETNVKTIVMEKLQPVATAANIAVDECDFGTALELGLDLFSAGHLELHMLVQSLLVPAYTLLHRPQFIAISKAHMEQRRRSLNLSIFELDRKIH